MKTYDMAELAVRNLRESILRNSLTTVGISVGVASLVAMLSLGIGLQQLAARRLQKSGLFDTVVVTSRRDLARLQSRAGRKRPCSGGKSQHSTNPRGKRLSNFPMCSRPILTSVSSLNFVTKTSRT